MTLIPLDHEIWTRLYGSYGTSNVAERLRSLSQNWDENLAAELFWDHLHHQDTLYPVTHAAVPWIWNIIASENPQTCREAYFFLSHFVACALHPEYGQTSGIFENVKYNGLTIVVRADVHDRLEKNAHLTDSDLLLMKQLEIWLDAHIEIIATTCARTALLIDQRDSIHLLTGYAELKYGPRLRNVLVAWHDGNDKQSILEWFPPDTAHKTIPSMPPGNSVSDPTQVPLSDDRPSRMTAESLEAELTEWASLIDEVVAEDDGARFTSDDAFLARNKWTEGHVKELNDLLVELDMKEAIEILKFVHTV